MQTNLKYIANLIRAFAFTVCGTINNKMLRLLLMSKQGYSQNGTLQKLTWWWSGDCSVPSIRSNCFELGAIYLPLCVFCCLILPTIRCFTTASYHIVLYAFAFISFNLLASLLFDGAMLIHRHNGLI